MLVTKATRTTAVALLSLLAAVLSAGDVHAQSFANFGQPCAPFSCASGRQAPAPKKCVLWQDLRPACLGWDG